MWLGYFFYRYLTTTLYTSLYILGSHHLSIRIFHLKSSVRYLFPEAKNWLSKIYKITNSLPSDKGFQYCQEMGTLTGCEDDLDCARLVCPSRERFSFKEVHFKKICMPVKASCPHAENVNITHASNIASAVNMLKHISVTITVSFQSSIVAYFIGPQCMKRAYSPQNPN